MTRKECEALHLSMWFTTMGQDSLMLPSSPVVSGQASHHRGHTAPVPSPTQSALPALFPLLFFPAPYIEYSTSTIWDSSSCSRDKRHGTQLKPGASHIFTKHQVLGASHLILQICWTTSDSRSAGLIFQLVTEHKCSFSINSGNSILPKCPSNNCTSSLEILSEKTLAQLYPAHRLTIFCSKCWSLL